MGGGITNGGLGRELDAEGLRPMSGVASSGDALAPETRGNRVRRRNRREAEGQAEDHTAEGPATEESDERERHQVDRIA